SGPGKAALRWRTFPWGDVVRTPSDAISSAVSDSSGANRPQTGCSIAVAAAERRARSSERSELGQSGSNRVTGLANRSPLSSSAVSPELSWVGSRSAHVYNRNLSVIWVRYVSVSARVMQHVPLAGDQFLRRKLTEGETKLNMKS
ncbi:hypothetical protein BaRGS_00028931, partial [Batillaria attramentaria]